MLKVYYLYNKNNTLLSKIGFFALSYVLLKQIMTSLVMVQVTRNLFFVDHAYVIRRTLVEVRRQNFYFFVTHSLILCGSQASKVRGGLSNCLFLFSIIFDIIGHSLKSGLVENKFFIEIRSS